jgi:hypothetical protein
MKKPVLRIRIRMFLGLLDPSIIKQKYKEKHLFLLFCDFFMNYYLENEMKNVHSKSNTQKNLEKSSFLLSS